LTGDATTEPPIRTTKRICFSTLWLTMDVVFKNL
jgi:hypothetical protein